MDNGNDHFEVGFQEAALKEKNLTITKLSQKRDRYNLVNIIEIKSRVI